MSRPPTATASMYTDVYSVSPAGDFRAGRFAVKTPADLAGVPISVGYQSGSHYSTLQALEHYLKPEQINLNFTDGMLFKRMELLIEGKAPAVSLFSGPYYFAEQLGFRKVIDTTFMIATMIHGDPDPEDLRSSSARYAGAARHRSAARALHALLTRMNSPTASMP